MSGQQFSYSLPSLEFTQVKGGDTPDFTLNGTITDLKSSLFVRIRSNLLSESTITTASVTIDKWVKTTKASFSQDISARFNDNGNARFTIGTTTTGSDIVAPIFSTYGSIPYNVLFEITVQDSDNVATTYSAVYKFNYYITPPTLTDFTFNTNIARGDQIFVSGLYTDPSYNVLYPTDVPSKVKFKFNQLELSNGDINDEFNEQYAPLVDYDPSGNYTLESNPLQNDNYYQITAIAYWSTGYSAVQNSGSDLFVIARPSINNIQAYDAQNDGGDDGVRADDSEQIIATIVLNPLLYVNYLPDEIRFLFYDMNNNLIGTSDQTANLYDPSYNQVSNNLVLTYNITLNSVMLEDNDFPLLNGMPGYSVYAQVNVPITIDGTSYDDQVRTSDAKTAVFRQGIAPILSLNVGNTWDMVTNTNPSSNPTLYGSSPLLGISGYFLKSGQFASGYDRNLDKTTTKFLLQYSVGQGTLANVVRAALIQQGSQETTEEAMIRAMGSVVSVSNGQYTNVVGPSGVVGPNQNPLVFYIPNVQDTFEETDNVNIFVTIIDTTSQWVDPSGNVNNESSSVSDDFIMVNKIPTYSYIPSTMKGTSVEPYINNVDVSNNDLVVLSNNVSSQVSKTGVIADSATSIITESPHGWTVVTPPPVNGVIPKVNLNCYSTISPVNTISDLDSYGMWCVINQNAGATQYPFLVAYTQPTVSGNASTLYKSMEVYSFTNSGGNLPSGFTLLYTGSDDNSLYPEIPANKRVNLTRNNILSSPSVMHAGISSELIQSVSIQTSSSTGNFNFTLLYAGVITDNSYTTTLFTDPVLNMNIPVNNTFSEYCDNSIIDNVSAPFGNVDVLTPTDTSSYILPNLTQNTYTVQYSIQNPNNNSAIVKGLVSSPVTIPTLNQPLETDFTVANFSFNTFNNEQKSSIVFDLTLNPYILDRIDGVHVYFTSDSNSNISQTQIGTFRTSQTGLEIFLLSDASSNLLGSGSNPHSYTDPLVSSQLLWNPYTSATITFVPFRDNRVNSDVAENENLVGTFTASTIWNIPVIDKPSVSGTISLDGGVVNSSSNTVLNWVNDDGADYDYPVSFSYVLTMVKDSNPATTVSYTVASPANVSASALLPIATNTNNTYTLTLKKIFLGQTPLAQYSLADTIVFNSVKVDTSVMVVSVLNPSNTSIVTASWVAPTITGTSSSFANNVASLYLTNNGTAMRSNVTSTTIEVIDASYNVLSQTMGYTYQFQMYVTARVPYSVNSGSSANSSAVPLALGPATAYTVSTIPNVSLAPYTALGTDSATVLIQNTNTPSLLLNLNANGLEVEGFISLVVVLTQDGTPSKPEGCEVLLQFPSVLNPTYLNDPSSNNLNQFLFPNIVGSAGNVNGNANLVGGESSTAVPLNLVPTGLSNNAGSYTLTIGSVILPSPQGPQPANVGRYGYSSLTFPANSGFVNGEASNIMAILTTRRGTDVMVGTFTFAAPPVASNVSVTSSGPGQYVLNFELN
jgi:hypothetical protein